MEVKSLAEANLANLASEGKPGYVNIAGLDKAELLAALYNNAVPLGMGFLRARSGKMSREEAQTEWIDKNKSHDVGIGGQYLYFDYVNGRPLKVDLSGNEMRTSLYNRDQGEGAAERVVAELRARQGT